MRRAEEEVADLAEVLAILGRCEVLHVGLCVDGVPYIVPLHFAFEQAGAAVSIFLHCAPEGRKMDMIRRNDQVCFEAECSVKTLEAEQACNWSAEFESVIGEGRICVLEDEAQKAKALDALMERHGFPGQPQYGEASLAAVTVLQIDVTSITGKRKRPQG